MFEAKVKPPHSLLLIQEKQEAATSQRPAPMMFSLQLMTTALVLVYCTSTRKWSTEAFVPVTTYASAHSRRSTMISSPNFDSSHTIIRRHPNHHQHPHPHADQHHQPLFMAEGGEEYSREVRLREEAESPFRKVRFFLYITLLGGALTSLAVSVARIAAAAAGVNTDLMQESLVNAGVDIAGIVVVGGLYKRDVDAEQSRLKRATKGAELAKLMVRASKQIIDGVAAASEDDGTTFTTSLASLRRGRGIEKRVVIAAGGVEKIAQVLRDARELAADMDMNDLVLVPVVMPQGVAPARPRMLDDTTAEGAFPSCVALPVAVGNNWKNVIDEEAAEAVKQGVDIEKEGFCVVVKKNGRVGQRTRGIFLDNMVGNVAARREAGMDVSNI